MKACGVIKIAVGFWLHLALFLCDLSAHASHPIEKSIVLVESGKPQTEWLASEGWSSQGEFWVGSGKSAALSPRWEIRSGEFAIRIEMTIDQLHHSAATFMIQGGHFGFEGGSGEMFTEGEIFGQRDLGEPVVKEGRAFVFEATRHGDELVIRIDGHPIDRVALASSQSVRFGLRPWRSTMKVHRWEVTGDLHELPVPLPRVDVFLPGTNGYPHYRIPAMVRTEQGTLLAFSEGRTGGDSGPIDLVLRRSLDSGRTWEPLQVIWDDGENTCGNPCPVVDAATGTVWLLMTWNRGIDDEREIMAGTSEDVRHVYVTHSTDDGQTWSTPQRISESTRRNHWRWYATGPGNGIQLTRGPHAGRLVIPCNHSDHESSSHPYRSHVIFSDDHGETWKLGGIQQDRTNESAVVERHDGSLLQAMRSYHGKNRRAVATSIDGGISWSDVRLDEALDTPICQASLLRYSWLDDPATDSRSRILFSSPRGSSRSQMTVWLSYDEGKSWPIQRLVHAGGAAYSNLVKLPNHQVGLLFERDGDQAISFVTFSLDWLEDE